MKTAADFRRAELRRKLRRAEERIRYWADAVGRGYLAHANDKLAYWSDIARILRRTLREE